ncbi:hypothetical protein Hanom_Chr02g00147581 [Helianthus anomalus]
MLMHTNLKSNLLKIHYMQIKVKIHLGHIINNTKSTIHKSQDPTHKSQSHSNIQ